MFDPKTAQESGTYVIEEKDFHIVCGDGNCLLYALSQSYSLDEAKLSDLRSNLSKEFEKQVKNYSALLDDPVYDKSLLPDWYNLLDAEGTEIHEMKIQILSTNLEKKQEINDIMKLIKKDHLRGWFYDFINKCGLTSRVKDWKNVVIALKKQVSLRKGFDTSITCYELSTNAVHIFLGPIGPFISSYFQKQIIVLTQKCNLKYTYTAIFGEKKNDVVPLVVLYSNSNHYDFWKRSTDL